MRIDFTERVTLEDGRILTLHLCALCGLGALVKTHRINQDYQKLHTKLHIEYEPYIEVTEAQQKILETGIAKAFEKENSENIIKVLNETGRKNTSD